MEHLGFNLRISPVDKLRVIYVLHSFQRTYGGEKNSLKFKFSDEDEDQWYLANENFGEGLFIDVQNFDPNELKSKQQGKFWIEYFSDHSHLTPFKKNQLNEFLGLIWLHTLSHRIMRGINIYTGYSSASIREKIYSQYVNGRFFNGILLYTSGQGSDGTLGGLSSSVRRFKDIIQLAWNPILDCSNDPICEEQQISGARPIGAACYACSYLSETSCELQNKFLDRILLHE